MSQEVQLLLLVIWLVVVVFGFLATHGDYSKWDE